MHSDNARVIWNTEEKFAGVCTHDHDFTADNLILKSLTSVEISHTCKSEAQNTSTWKRQESSCNRRTGCFWKNILHIINWRRVKKRTDDHLYESFMFTYERFTPWKKYIGVSMFNMWRGRKDQTKNNIPAYHFIVGLLPLYRRWRLLCCIQSASERMATTNIN